MNLDKIAIITDGKQETNEIIKKIFEKNYPNADIKVNFNAEDKSYYCHYNNKILHVHHKTNLPTEYKTKTLEQLNTERFNNSELIYELY